MGDSGVIDYGAILTAEFPGARWILDGDDYAGLTWLSDSPKPTQAELDAAWPAVQAARQHAAVQQARAARYKAETDPMFFKAQRGEDGVTLADWQAAVDAIRADLPYPA
jgi:hypothetical protein